MKKGNRLLVIIMLVVGVSLLLYPQVSNLIAHYKQQQVIENYLGTLEEISDDRYKEVFDAAVAYNESLYAKQKDGQLRKDGLDNYDNILKIDEAGILGYIEIPTIDVRIPIYHGTDENVLQVGVGHSSYTSVPIGGENTHAMLFGHSALPRAKLFTDLETLHEDDYFTINVLNRKLYYQVRSIVVIEPDELSQYLYIEDGKDLVTLVTCTPYGVNSHRLVITGERTDEISESYEEIAVSSGVSDLHPPAIVAILIAAIGIIIIIIIIKIRRKKHA